MEAPEYLDLDEIDFSDDISVSSYGCKQGPRRFCLPLHGQLSLSQSASPELSQPHLEVDSRNALWWTKCGFGVSKTKK